MENNVECCGSCRFFLPFAADPKNLKAPVMGICRRYPPDSQITGFVPDPGAPNGKRPEMGRSIPMVSPGEWCGEWSLRKPAGKIIPTIAEVVSMPGAPEEKKP